MTALYKPILRGMGSPAPVFTITSSRKWAGRAGLGFISFFTPVREAMAEMLNTACKSQTNRKFASWKKTAAYGAWDPAYIWPSGALAQEEDNDQGKCVKVKQD